MKKLLKFLAICALLVVPLSVKAVTVTLPLIQGGTGINTSTKGSLLVEPGGINFTNYLELGIGGMDHVLAASSTSTTNLSWATLLLDNGAVTGVNATTSQAAFEIQGVTINNAASGNAVSRGLYISPSITKATDFRAIDIAPYTFAISSTTALTQAYGSLFGQLTVNTTTVATLPGAAGLYINGAPKSTTNLTITSSTALSIVGGSVSSTTNAISLYVQAPTGATNNYAAAFVGTYGAIEPATTTISSTSYTMDLSKGNFLPFSVATSTTITFSNAQTGAAYYLQMRQDTTGSRTITFSNCNWSGGSAPTFTTTANKIDLVVVRYSTAFNTYYCQSDLNH